MIEEAEQEQIEEAEPTLPDKFKQQAKWLVFKEAVCTHFSHLRGSNQYVIHKLDVPEAGAQCATERE